MTRRLKGTMRAGKLKVAVVKLGRMHAYEVSGPSTPLRVIPVSKARAETALRHWRQTRTITVAL
jgi:hypothetical protein